MLRTACTPTRFLNECSAPSEAGSTLVMRMCARRGRSRSAPAAAFAQRLRQKYLSGRIIYLRYGDGALDQPTCPCSHVPTPQARIHHTHYRAARPPSSCSCSQKSAVIRNMAARSSREQPMSSLAGLSRCGKNTSTMSQSWVVETRMMMMMMR